MVSLLMILFLTNFTRGYVQPSQDYGSIIEELQELQAGKVKDRDFDTDPEIEIKKEFPQKTLNNFLKSNDFKKSSYASYRDRNIYWQ